MNERNDKSAGHQLDVGYGSENPEIEEAFRVADEARPPKARRGGRLVVCAAAELPPGRKRIVEDGALSIGVFNIDGRFYAIRNVCPHMGAPLCAGSVHATLRPSGVHDYVPALQGRVIRCPWHGWEFDIITGKGLYDRRSRVATYAVEVDENGDVVVLV